MKKRKLSGDDFEQVLGTVREYVFQNHRFPQINDIVKQSGLPKTKCKQICDCLITQKKLYIAFEGPTMPQVVMPYELMQEMLRNQPKPKWISEYEFKEKTELDNQIEELQKQTYDYEMFERLLYATDIPLEEAVAFALKWLDFTSVEHHADTDKPEITFEYDGIKALVEVEGTTGPADKRKVQQLAGWLTQEIEEEGRKADELQGFLVVNHYRDKNPTERDDPLTSKAKEFLKLNRSRFFTTSFLFNIVREVMKRVSRDEARRKVWEGEAFKGKEM